MPEFYDKNFQLSHRDLFRTTPVQNYNCCYGLGLVTWS